MKNNVRMLFTKTEIIKFVLIVVLGIILFVAGMFYVGSKSLVEFRSTIYADILEFVVFLLFTIILSFNRKINMPTTGKVLVIGFPVLHFALGLFSIGKISFFIFFLYSIINIFIAIYIYNQKEYKSIWLFGAFAYIISVMPILRVQMIDSQFPFWEISLIICALTFGIVLLISLCKFSVDKNVENLISFPILAIMAGFGLPWLSINSFNIVFDHSEPIAEVFEITDKNVSTGARQITTYNVEVLNDNNSFKIAISQEDYYNYEIGDEITLYIYQGAFNEKYYLHQSNK